MIGRAHPFFPALRALMRDAAANAPVFDLGTNRRFAKEVGLCRELFAEEHYFAGGYHPEPADADACDFHCDVQDLRDIEDGTAGCVLSMEVLEHVEEPAAAVAEMHRILRPGGILIAGVPFLASYHGNRPRPVGNAVYDTARTPLVSDNRHSSFGDYWRFTHEGLARLLAQAGFARVEVWPVDGWLIARLEVAGVYDQLARLAPLRWLIRRLDRPRLGRATTLHFARAVKAPLAQVATAATG